MASSDKTEKIRKHSKTLSSLGSDIAKMRFSYEIKRETGQKYWERRIEEHKEYFERSREYYNQAYMLIKLVSEEQAGMFLLALGKFHQLKTRQLEILERIRKSPTIMEPRDRQQSRWSKETREEIIENSNKCLEHEKNMSILFKKFFDEKLKDV